MNELKVLSAAYPWVPVGHPDFKWTSGADVQATWRKHGWTPPSEHFPPPPAVVREEPTWLRIARRIK
jgi:hypothetical protein